MATKLSHTFQGSTYMACSYEQHTSRGYRWYRIVKHPSTGLMYDELACPTFRTLAECRCDALREAFMREDVSVQFHS